MALQYHPNLRGMIKEKIDDGLISSGSIKFATDDDSRAEKSTGTIALTTPVHPDGLYLLSIDNSTGTASGSVASTLTLTTYNVVKVDGVNLRDCIHTTHISSTGTTNIANDYIIQGLFYGEGQIKIGAKYAADSGTVMSVYYKLYRI